MSMHENGSRKRDRFYIKHRAVVPKRKKVRKRPKKGAEENNIRHLHAAATAQDHAVTVQNALHQKSWLDQRGKTLAGNRRSTEFVIFHSTKLCARYSL